MHMMSLVLKFLLVLVLLFLLILLLQPIPTVVHPPPALLPKPRGGFEAKHVKSQHPLADVDAHLAGRVDGDFLQCGGSGGIAVIVVVVVAAIGGLLGAFGQYVVDKVVQGVDGVEDDPAQVDQEELVGSTSSTCTGNASASPTPTSTPTPGGTGR